MAEWARAPEGRCVAAFALRNERLVRVVVIVVKLARAGMLLRLVALFFLGLLATGIWAVDWEEEDGVIIVTEENFDKVIASHEYVLVKFYAPWCGHCKALAPEYVKAAKALADEGSPIRLAKCDATVHTDLATKFEVHGYPTLKLFRSGKAVDYRGGRDASGIVAWLKKKYGPAVKNLATSEDIAQLRDTSDAICVAYFKDPESAEAKTFTELAEGFEDLPFGIVSDAAMGAEVRLEAEGVVLLRNADGEAEVFTGEISVEGLRKWIHANRLPLVTEFSPELAPIVFGGEIKSHLLLFLSKADPEYASIFSTFKEVSKHFRGDITYVHINVDVEEHTRLMGYFGVSKGDVPSLRMIYLSNDIVNYRPDFVTISAENLMEFSKDYLAGKLKPYLMSEEIPEDWDKNPVKVLVGKNFEQVVLDVNKDVFVKFYAPWCGHCKQLKPIWEELGAKYQDSEKVVIAKIDATANEVQGVKIRSFPTLKFSAAGSKEMVDYTGDLTLEGFVKFLESDDREAVLREMEEKALKKEKEEEEPMKEGEGDSEKHEDEPAGERKVVEQEPSPLEPDGEQEEHEHIEL